MIDSGLTLTKRKHLDILKAAVELFQLHGFDNTNMDAIALNAKVSKRTIYKHFSDKNALFQAILKELFSRIMTVADYTYQSGVSIEIQLTEIAHLFVEFLTSECVIKITRVVLVELIRSPKKATETFLEFNGESLGISKWISSAQKDKRLKVADKEIASKQFISLLKEFAFWPQIIEGRPALSKVEKKKLINTTVQFFLKNYAVK
jgi:TetR/AcrR family transcriptional regulator of autoinduction and epiphytic fitness